ncbi:hypothetical protein LTR15_002434 [Elasticomyces elasticus]|nr:hypothetical protein LTR15_002434 [Elasticomyces elasticus]
MPPPHLELQLQQSQDQYTVMGPLPEMWRPELSLSRSPKYNLNQQWPDYDPKLYEGGQTEAGSGSDEHRRQTKDYINVNSMEKYAQDPQPEINAQRPSYGPTHYKFAPTNNGYGTHQSLSQTYNSCTNDNTPFNFSSFGNNSMPVQPAPPGITYSKFRPVFVGELTPAQMLEAGNAVDRPAHPQQRQVRYAGPTRRSQVGVSVNSARPPWPQLDVSQYNDGMQMTQRFQPQPYAQPDSGRRLSGADVRGVAFPSKMSMKRKAQGAIDRPMRGDLVIDSDDDNSDDSQQSSADEPFGSAPPGKKYTKRVSKGPQKGKRTCRSENWGADLGPREAPQTNSSLPPDVPLTAAELTMIFVNHSWPPITKRLMDAGWTTREIAAAQLHSHDEATDEAITKRDNALRKQVEHTLGLPTATDFGTSTFQQNTNRRTLQVDQLTRFGENIANFPPDEEHGYMTQAVQYALEHPELDLTVNDVARLAREKEWKFPFDLTKAPAEADAISRTRVVKMMVDAKVRLGRKGRK